MIFYIVACLLLLTAAALIADTASVLNSLSNLTIGVPGYNVSASLDICAYSNICSLYDAAAVSILRTANQETGTFYAGVGVSKPRASGTQGTQNWAHGKIEFIHQTTPPNVPPTKYPHGP